MDIGIYGPTASGKTKLSIEIGKVIKDVVLVNFDSCQFLNYLPNLTMKPEKTSFTEYLFGIKGPEDYKFTANDFVHEVNKIPQYNNRIFVGGSGFYLLYFINTPSRENMKDSKIMNYIENRSKKENYSHLSQLDPNNKIHINDTYRVNHHLHYFLKNNCTINATPKTFKKIFNIFLNPSKEWLHKNIEKRTNLYFPKMVEEVNEFNKNYSNFKTNIIGYKEISQFILGSITEYEAKDTINLKTRQYAKTQVTFLKNKLQHNLIINENYNLEKIADILKNV